MKIFNHMLEIDIFRNSSLNNLGVLKGPFKGFVWLRLLRVVNTIMAGDIEKCCLDISYL